MDNVATKRKRRRRVTERKGAKEYLASAEHLTHSPVPLAEFKPTRNHQAALLAVVCKPRLATRKRELSEAVGLCETAIYKWFSNPQFRAWWNERLKVAARDHLGPALMELLAIVHDEDATASEKVKATEAFAKLMDQHGHSTQSGVKALLETLWGMNLTSARVVTDGQTLAAEFRREVGRDDAAEETDVTSAAPSSDNARYVVPSVSPTSSTALPPEAAVQLPPDLRERAAEGGRQYIRDAVDEERASLPKVIEVQTESIDLRRPMPRPGLVALPQVVEGEGASEITKADPESPRDPHTPDVETLASPPPPSRQNPQQHLDDAMRRAER